MVSAVPAEPEVVPVVSPVPAEPAQTVIAVRAPVAPVAPVVPVVEAAPAPQAPPQPVAAAPSLPKSKPAPVAVAAVASSQEQPSRVRTIGAVIAVLVAVAAIGFPLSKLWFGGQGTAAIIRQDQPKPPVQQAAASPAEDAVAPAAVATSSCGRDISLGHCSGRAEGARGKGSTSRAEGEPGGGESHRRREGATQVGEAQWLDASGQPGCLPQLPSPRRRFPRSLRRRRSLLLSRSPKRRRRQSVSSSRRGTSTKHRASRPKWSRRCPTICATVRSTRS